MALKIKKAEIEDIPKIMSLINSCAVPYKSADYLKWWHFSSLIPTVTFCAAYDEEFIGMFKIYKRKLVNNLNCGVLMGLAIKEKWRGKGLFKELGVKAMDYFEDLDLLCCFPNLNGKRALEKNFNFRTIDNIETMILTNNTNFNCQDYVCNPITPKIRFNNINIEKEDTFIFLADEDFRQWRFTLHPRYSYYMIRIDSNEFVITNIYYDKEKNIRYGDIVDFQASVLEENRLINLFNCACSILKKDVDMVTIQAVPNSLLYEVVKKKGFVKSNIKHFFCIKIKEPHNEYLYNSSNWLIKWGDYLR